MELSISLVHPATEQLQRKTWAAGEKTWEEEAGLHVCKWIVSATPVINLSPHKKERYFAIYVCFSFPLRRDDVGYHHSFSLNVTSQPEIIRLFCYCLVGSNDFRDTCGSSCTIHPS